MYTWLSLWHSVHVTDSVTQCTRVSCQGYTPAPGTPLSAPSPGSMGSSQDDAAPLGSPHAGWGPSRLPPASPSHTPVPGPVSNTLTHKSILWNIFPLSTLRNLHDQKLYFLVALSYNLISKKMHWSNSSWTKISCDILGPMHEWKLSNLEQKSPYSYYYCFIDRPPWLRTTDWPFALRRFITATWWAVPRPLGRLSATPMTLATEQRFETAVTAYPQPL